MSSHMHTLYSTTSQELRHVLLWALHAHVNVCHMCSAKQQPGGMAIWNKFGYWCVCIREGCCTGEWSTREARQGRQRWGPSLPQAAVAPLTAMSFVSSAQQPGWPCTACTYLSHASALTHHSQDSVSWLVVSAMLPCCSGDRSKVE